MKSNVVRKTVAAFLEYVLGLAIFLHVSISNAEIKIRIGRWARSERVRQDIHGPYKLTVRDRLPGFFDLCERGRGEEWQQHKKHRWPKPAAYRSFKAAERRHFRGHRRQPACGRRNFAATRLSVSINPKTSHSLCLKPNRL